jgi:galactitol-specific phosphotransferase system IIC component
MKSSVFKSKVTGSESEKKKHYRRQLLSALSGASIPIALFFGALLLVSVFPGNWFILPIAGLAVSGLMTAIMVASASSEAQEQNPRAHFFYAGWTAMAALLLLLGNFFGIEAQLSEEQRVDKASQGTIR